MINTFLIDNCTFQGCNKTCTYCRKDSNLQAVNFVEQALELTDQNVMSSILKISGYGEITMLSNWRELLTNHSRNHNQIQVITNGTLLTSEDIKWVASRNYSLCFSLDGISAYSNQARESSKSEIKKIVQNIRLARSLNVPVEINTVLTKFNIDSIPEFLKFFKDLGVAIYPFPVRKNRLYGTGDLLKPGSKQTRRTLSVLLDHFDLYETVLPPKPYIVALNDFMLKGMRGTCYMPKIALGIDPNGDILRCACSGLVKIANILTEGKDAFSKYAAQRSISGYEEGCEDCFTHYEVINLFLDGKISQVDMKRLPLFKKQDLTKSILETT